MPTSIGIGIDIIKRDGGDVGSVPPPGFSGILTEIQPGYVLLESGDIILME